ncbi:MAG: molybdopterin converting factor subunit 1 [Xanthobacteraceae bacterium]
MKIRYFAWVRERIGVAEEDIDLPAGIATVGELVDWLATRGDDYAYAFENRKTIRTAIDKTHVRADAPIEGAAEIAFFPPMTGG